MRAVWLITILVCGAAVLAPSQVCAQPLSPQTESIDSLVWNSDYVLIAKLEELRSGEEVGEHRRHKVTIAIEESLKQPPLTETHPRMSFHFPHPESVLADWKKRNCRLLVAYDEYYPESTTVIDLTPSKVEVMTADFLLLRKPEAVIKAAREVARNQPVGVKRLHTFKLAVPRDIVAGTKWERYYDTGGSLMLSVPVDERLKKRAEAYIRTEENRSQHYEGEQALRYFKSDENPVRGEVKTEPPALFGVPLGISREEFSRVCAEADAEIAAFGGGGGDTDVSLSNATINRTLSPVSGQASTTVTFADDRALKVRVDLNDLSLKGWKRIRNRLIKKYGPSDRGTTNEGDAGDYYRTQTPAVHIDATYFGRTVRIEYVHAELQQHLDKLRAERERERLKRRGTNDSVRIKGNL